MAGRRRSMKHKIGVQDATKSMVMVRVQIATHRTRREGKKKWGCNTIVQIPFNRLRKQKRMELCFKEQESWSWRASIRKNEAFTTLQAQGVVQVSRSKWSHNPGTKTFTRNMSCCWWVHDVLRSVTWLCCCSDCHEKSEKSRAVITLRVESLEWSYAWKAMNVASASSDSPINMGPRAITITLR